MYYCYLRVYLINSTRQQKTPALSSAEVNINQTKCRKKQKKGLLINCNSGSINLGQNKSPFWRGFMIIIVSLKILVSQIITMTCVDDKL